MQTTKLGNTEIAISRIGLGAMPLSLANRPSEEQAISVIHRALQLGVTLIDTADSYCKDENDKHHNEILIAKALSTYRGNTDDIIVATKGGLMRPSGDWTVNGNPDHLRKTINESYEALGGTHPIPLWQWHAPDDRYPIRQSLKPVKEAVDQKLIRFVGLSNVSVDEIKQAQTMFPIVSIQNQYNPWCRNPERDGVLQYCEDQKLTFLPWSPLGGSRRVKLIGNFKELAKVARERDASPHCLVLAWLMAKSPCIVPIPGATRIQSLEDSLAAEKINLSASEISAIEKDFPG
ncbi:MAG: aldo/keto reductase [Deltaproteobacteria bacterium RIFCSPLOWO2_02_FULL_44_10]|nr:MAG: aldo/keto reductase [Deltaproteobacteria bacterium RIFCSPHIGHO2_02_FULL_44_16]OGQ47547.1 MAG: aldo/keto reductase [Deltaproteobacteria bacterium RIFCSPLOWO2_02_FULL_44_10]